MQVSIRINGNKVEGSAKDIASILDNLQKTEGPQVLQSEISEDHDITTDFAIHVLRRRPLSKSQRELLSLLKLQNLSWVSATQIREKLDMNGNQLGGVFGGLGRRLSATEGANPSMSLFEWKWNDEEREYDCRLHPAANEALERIDL